MTRDSAEPPTDDVSDAEATRGAAQTQAALARRMRNGIFWLYLSRYAGKALFFVSTLILARLLAPEDFALVALALAILGVVEAADFGVGAALVWLDKDEVKSHRSVAFTLNNLSVAFIAILLYFLAPAAGALTDDPRATWVFRALVLVVVIRALGLTHANLLRRDMDFRRRFLPELLGGVTKGVLAVVLAFSGFGVWALVLATIAGTTVNTIGLWVVMPFRPRFDLGMDGRATRLIRFGASVSFVGVLTAISANVDYIIVGNVLGLTALGFYVIAFRIPELILVEGLQTASQAMFPYYARARELAVDPGARFLGTSRVSSLIAAPIVAILAGLATPLIVFLFGEKWEPAAAALPALAIYAAFNTISGFAGDLYLAIGKPWILWVLGVPQVLIEIVAIWLVAPYGFAAVAGALAGVAIAISLVRWEIAARVVGLRRIAVARAFCPALIAGALAWLVASAISRVFSLEVAALAGPALVTVAYLAFASALAPEVRGAALTIVRLLASRGSEDGRPPAPGAGSPA